MVNRLITAMMLISVLATAQTDWWEQPMGFGVGVGIGMISGKRIPPVLLGLSLATGKGIYDLNRGKPLQPFTIGYGAFVSATMRIEYSRRRMLKRKTEGV